MSRCGEHLQFLRTAKCAGDNFGVIPSYGSSTGPVHEAVIREVS